MQLWSLCSSLSSLLPHFYYVDSSYVQGATSRVYLPNIPDFYFSQENITGFRTLSNNAANIFTLPHEAGESYCNGTVVTVQFCYEIEDLRVRGIRINFMLISRNDYIFTTQLVFEVITDRDSDTCVASTVEGRQICCTTRNLSTPHSLQMCNSTNFTFAILTGCCHIFVLSFNNSEGSFAEHFETSFKIPPRTEGGTFTLNKEDSNETNFHPLMRFIIGKKHTYRLKI